MFFYLMLALVSGSPWRCDTSEFDDLVVGVNDLVVTESGSVYFLDTRESRVYHLNDMGDLVGTFGQKGQGPGEFITAWEMTFLEDTRNLVVIEHGESAFHFFDAEGNFLSTERIPDKARYQPTVLLTKNRIVYVRKKTGQDASFIMVDLDTGKECVLREHGSRYHGDPTIVRTAKSETVIGFPWTPRSLLAKFTNGHILTGSTRGIDFAIHDLEGNDIGTIEDPRMETRPLLREEIEGILATVTINGKRPRASDLDTPHVTVSISGINIDLDDRLWIYPNPPPGMENKARLRVYDKTGSLLGEMRVPEDIEIHQAAGSFLYGFSVDADNEDSILVEKKAFKLE